MNVMTRWDGDARIINDHAVFKDKSVPARQRVIGPKNSEIATSVSKGTTAFDVPSFTSHYTLRFGRVQT